MSKTQYSGLDVDSEKVAIAYIPRRGANSSSPTTDNAEAVRDVCRSRTGAVEDLTHAKAGMLSMHTRAHTSPDHSVALVEISVPATNSGVRPFSNGGSIRHEIHLGRDILPPIQVPQESLQTAPPIPLAKEASQNRALRSPVPREHIAAPFCSSLVISHAADIPIERLQQQDGPSFSQHTAESDPLFPFHWMVPRITSHNV